MRGGEDGHFREKRVEVCAIQQFSIHDDSVNFLRVANVVERVRVEKDQVRAFTRWDEKAGLPRDAIRSQCSTCSKHNEKETGNAED